MTRPLVFVSYARLDAEEMEALCSHLGALEWIDVWVDRKGLQGGDDWEPKIRSAIASADLAILLVTPRFLNSQFIKNVEVPLILERHGRGQAIVLPVIGKPCFWDGTEWLRKFNVRPESGVPVWDDDGRHADNHLAKITAEVARLLAPAPKNEPPPRPAPPAPSTPTATAPAPLRTYETRMPNVGLFASDARGRLWVSDGEQVKVFRLGQNHFPERWPLPNRRWKTWLAEVWAGRAVFADWDGSLFASGSRGGGDGQALFPARPDSLPIHRLATGPGDWLVGASWDGRVRSWDAGGNLQGEDGISVPNLPTHLVPLADRSLGVVDQAGYLRLYDPAGREVWSWRADGRIHQVWGCAERGGWSFLMQVGRTRLVKVRAGRTPPAILEFEEPIVSIARLAGGEGEEWAVVGREGGKVDWVCLSPFRTVRDNRVDVPFTVRDLHAVRDARQPASLLAVGLTSAGQLFSLEEREVRLHPTPEPVRRLVADPTGGFLFLLGTERAFVVRNPVMAPIPLVAALESVQGTLLVSAFTRIVVRLRNTGAPAIHDIRGELRADGLIDPSRASRPPHLPVLPDQVVELAFAVRACVAGPHVPLTLQLELIDEGGEEVWTHHVRVEVESRGA